MTAIIRPAVIDDVETISDLIHDLSEFLGHSEDMKASVADLKNFGFGDQPFYKALIAEDAGKPVGLCTYYTTFSSWRGRPGICILDLYVDPNLRGSGLGRRLMAETAKAGQAMGATFLNLSVHTSNLSGQKFYSAMGMDHMNSEQLFLIEGDVLANLILEAEGGLL